MYKSVLPLLFAVLFAACQPRRAAVETVGGRIQELSAKQLLGHLAEHRVDFEWLGAKTHAEVDLPGGPTMGFALNVRVRRDSLIWLQFMKMGIEGARARITPQGGLEILNRQERTYTVLSFAELENRYGVPLDYAELQDLLVGQPTGLSGRRFRSSISEGMHVLSSNDGGEGLQFYLEDRTFFLRRYIRQARSGKLDLTLDGYAPAAGRDFAKIRRATVAGRNGQPLALDIEVNELELDVPQRVAFDVPEKYRRQ